MPSSTLKRRGGVHATPLPTDENHPDYPDSCDRDIRSARAGLVAYRKFDSLLGWFNSQGMGSGYLTLHGKDKWTFPEELESILGDRDNYDDQGTLKDEWVGKLGDYFVREQSLEHNVLWDEAERHFVKERMRDRLEYGKGRAELKRKFIT